MDDKIKTRRLSVTEQPKDRLYEMSIRFVADAVPSAIAELTEACGFAERPVLPRAVTSRIIQTVPFIPDDGVLDAYARTIKENPQPGIRLSNVRFDGYDYVYPVICDDTGPDTPERNE